MTPIALFESVWQRCDQLAALHVYLVGHLTPALSVDEMLRAEWVARVSALDLYVHELVSTRMVATFENSRPSSTAYKGFKVSNDCMARVRTAATVTDASAAFDLEVRGRLSLVTYQDPEDIAEGIRLISNVELWNQIALQKGANQTSKIAKAKSLKRQLSLIVRRRNKIAHEGDLQLGVPRIPWPIARPDVDFASNFIRDLVYCIDLVVA